MTDNPKVALIVGAGTPLGQQVGRGLAAEGYRLALNDLLPNHIERLAAELGEQAVAFPADLSRKLALQTVVQNILEAWERIDVLVFVPSAQPGSALMELDEWDWHRALDLNVSQAFLCMQSVGRVMRELGGGVMVNVAALTAEMPPAQQAGLGGLAAVTQAAVEEFAAVGIAVHSAPADADAILKLCLQD